MKMMLSMPRTISSATSVKKATHDEGSESHSIESFSPFRLSYYHSAATGMCVARNNDCGIKLKDCHDARREVILWECSGGLLISVFLCGDSAISAAQR